MGDLAKALAAKQEARAFGNRAWHQAASSTGAIAQDLVAAQIGLYRPNDVVARELPTLIRRVQWGVDNLAWIARAADVLAQNWIGWGWESVIQTPDGRADDRLTARWQAWQAGPVDVTSGASFGVLQTLVAHAIFTTGEAVIERTADGLHVWGGDWIDPLALDQDKRIVCGVEFDPRGREVALHVADPSAGSTSLRQLRGSTERRRIERANYVRARRVMPSMQVRTAPSIHRALPDALQLSQIERFVAARTKVAAAASWFLKPPPSFAVSTAPVLPSEMEAGSALTLPAGWDMTVPELPTAEPLSAVAQYLTRKIAAVADITYAALTGDLSEASFSSERMGWIEMQRGISLMQWQVLEPAFSQVARWWMSAQGVDPTSRLVEWTPPRREIVDPSREIGAAVQAIDRGLISVPEWHAQHGYRTDVVLRQRAEYARKAAELGLDGAAASVAE